MPVQPFHLFGPPEIHIWKVSLRLEKSDTSCFEALLSRDEKQRCAQFRFDHLRRRYILAHGALRVLLSGYCGRLPETLRFRAGRYGKPFLADPPGRLHFNLSHCEDLSLIAVTPGGYVGIDVERVRPLQELGLALDRFFTAEERHYIRSAHGDDQSQNFFTLWTRREAAAKALGLNLQAALAKIRIPLFPPLGNTVVPGFMDALETSSKPETFWYIQDLKLDASHRGAVCFEGKKCAISVREFK